MWAAPATTNRTLLHHAGKSPIHSNASPLQKRFRKKEFFHRHWQNTDWIAALWLSGWSDFPATHNQQTRLLLYWTDAATAHGNLQHPLQCVLPVDNKYPFD